MQVKSDSKKEQMTIEEQIHEWGWDLVCIPTIGTCKAYRARQGDFVTPFRKSPEEVLQDIQKMREKKSEQV